jgi:hypothetical protein
MNQNGMPTASGLNDFDYENISALSKGLKKLEQLQTVNKIPIPPEIMEHFKRKQMLKNHSSSSKILNTIFRNKMPLYDGTVSRDRSSMVNHRFRYLRECYNALLCSFKANQMFLLDLDLRTNQGRSIL